MSEFSATSHCDTANNDNTEQLQNLRKQYSELKTDIEFTITYFWTSDTKIKPKADGRKREFENRRDIIQEVYKNCWQQKSEEKKLSILQETIDMLKELQTDVKNFIGKDV